MRYLEFVEHTWGDTEIRRIEKLKRIWGSHVELVGFIKEVGQRHVSIVIPDDPRDLYHVGTLVFLRDDGSEGRFKRQLLECSVGDQVEITAQVDKSSSPFNTGTEFHFHMVSMTTLSTREDQERARKRDERRAEEQAAQAKLERSATAATSGGCVVGLIGITSTAAIVIAVLST
jgi:hypothetical protein